MTDGVPSRRENSGRDGDLAGLAERANAAHEHVGGSLQQALAQALEAGRALLAAREICPGGRFTQWLRANFRASSSTARGYMRLVANWHQLEGDLQRAGGLSQRQMARLLKGLPCSDGRANPRAAVKQLPAPAAAPTDSALPPSGGARQESGRPIAVAGDPLELVGRLLEQAITELRRLGAASGQESPYAMHLLRPLESIRLGIPLRKWFWELVED